MELEVLRMGRSEAFSAVEDLVREHRELLRLAERCVNPFADGEETCTQAEALYDLEAWLRTRDGGPIDGGV
jgi:hypothetical protein